MKVGNLQAALHSRAAGAIAVVNLGDDADTVGAVYGQLAGALHGEERLPSEWLEKLAWKDHIRNRARELVGLPRAVDSGRTTEE